MNQTTWLIWPVFPVVAEARCLERSACMLAVLSRAAEN